MYESVSKRNPFDLGPGSTMDDPIHFCAFPPEAEFIPSGSAARNAFGHRYGSELLVLDEAMIERLRNGEQLAVEISQGEYILYIQYGDKEVVCK